MKIGILQDLQYYWHALLKKMRGKMIKDSHIHKTSKICAGSQIVDSEFGKYSYCGYDCIILNCKIGSFTSIASNVNIGRESHTIEWASSSPVFCSDKIVIKKKFSNFERVKAPKTILGNDVWIGQGSQIKAGIKIGNGAVIGMGSIVTHDVPPYEIWAGCPAHFIRKRFDDETISVLERSKWWDWEDEKIKKHAKDIKDPRKFVEED